MIFRIASFSPSSNNTKDWYLNVSGIGKEQISTLIRKVFKPEKEILVGKKICLARNVETQQGWLNARYWGRMCIFVEGAGLRL